MEEAPVTQRYMSFIAQKVLRQKFLSLVSEPITFTVEASHLHSTHSRFT